MGPEMLLESIQAGLMASGLWLAAGSVPGCPVPPIPNVSVYAVTAATKIDDSLPMNVLETFELDTDTAKSATNMTHAKTGGVMRGTIGIEYSIEMDWQPAETGGLSCLHFSEVNIILTLEPTIFIARDFARGGCVYNAVRDHEMEHVAIDRTAIEAYAAQIDRAFDFVFEVDGNRQSPPIADNEVTVMRSRMQQAVINQTEQILRDMYADRMARQNALDSPQTYAELMRQCPDAVAEMAR